MITATATTKEFRQMLHSGEGQPIPQWVKTEARRAAMDTLRMTGGDTREANRVYEETFRAYGYEPDDCEGL